MTLGRNTAPLFVSTLLFNPFGNSFAFSPMISHGYLAMGRLPCKAIRQSTVRSCIRHRMSEASGSLLYSNAGMAGHTGQANYSANVLYFAGPFSATAAVQSLHTASLFLNGATAQMAWLVGGAYRIHATKLMFQYERVSNNSNVTDDTVQVGASARFGMGSMLLSWAGTRRRPVTGSGIRWSTFALGYDYPLSKRTDIYAAWRYDTITCLIGKWRRSRGADAVLICYASTSSRNGCRCLWLVW